MFESEQKPVRFVAIPPPPPEQRVCRGATFAPEGTKRDRYALPGRLDSASPVGYRTRLSLRPDEAQHALDLLSMERPTAFHPGAGPTEQELFEECALGVLSARQSTNYRGHEQVTLGPADSARAAALLRTLAHREAEPLEGATHTHLVLSRPYRTPFTLLLTFVGHRPITSLVTVPMRAWRKRTQHADDIPTIGYLQHLHVGILADAMERAAVLASDGRRRAMVFMAPFAGAERLAENHAAIEQLQVLAGLTASKRARGWRLALVAQVGHADPIAIPRATCRRIAANLLAFRSERIQPGVNHEDKAPAQYRTRQDMDVPDELTEMAGRAGLNAFTHWTGRDRERARDVLVLDRIDVLTPGGKERLRAVRRELEAITDRVVRDLPLWADLPTGRALSRNALRGKKAFALTGQRIYLGGLSRSACASAGLGWEHAIRAFGAAASRSGLVAEIAGATDIPDGCDLLGGVCLMAGPVNQNDIGKQFYGMEDLLAARQPHRDPTALLVWTLKAKTVADPIGNEEQLLSAAQKGALVDLRAGPHEVCATRHADGLRPMRRDGETYNTERAYHDQGSFVTDPGGVDIPGNRGAPWPAALAERAVWPD